jgi:branched-chain amino acid aminotransferase
MNAIPLQTGQITLQAAQSADEAFVTGTMGGITPVRAIDGHAMASPGPITAKLRTLYGQLMDADAAAAALP